MNEDSIRRIKERLSLIYISALAGKLDLGFEDHRGKDKDIRFGIDCTLTKATPGINRAEAISGEINFQVKATSVSSTTMYREDEKNIYYKLKRNLDPVSNFYLVLLVLPSHEDIHTWVEQDVEKLILRKCAYFLKLDDSMIEQMKTTVTIPKTNLLTPDSIMNMFTDPSKKEEI